MGLRVYFIDENNLLMKVPQARWQRLWNCDPNEKFPEHAGKKLKEVLVSVEIRNRKPINIYKTEGSYIRFNSEGQLTEEYIMEVKRAVSASVEGIFRSNEPKSNEKIIDAISVFRGKYYRNKYTWNVPGDIINKIHNSTFAVAKNM